MEVISDCKDVKLNNKEDVKFVGYFYRQYTPVKGGVYDTTHKNWHIAGGADYANAILYMDGMKVLEKCIKDKTIKYSKLRQNKDTNIYFWIGMKLVYILKNKKTYRIFLIENDKKILADEFQNESKARFYIAVFEILLKKYHLKRKIKISIEEV